MTEYNVSVVVEADTDGLTSGADQAAGAIDDLAAKAEEAGGTVESGLATAGDAASGLGESMSGVADTIDTATTDIGTSVGNIPAAAADAASAIDSSASDISTTFDGLSQDATAAADSITQSLQTDVPGAVDGSAATISTKAAKFKQVGAQLGTTLTEGIADGVAGPEATLSLSQALAGLVAISAKTGPGIIAALGLGAGFALFKNVIDQSKAAKEAIEADVEEWVGKFVEGVGKIDAAAKRATFEAELNDKTSELNRVFNELGSNAQGAIIRAFVGTPTQRQSAVQDLRGMLDAVKGQIGPMQELVASGEGNRDANVEALAALEDQKGAIRDALGLLDEEVGKRGEAADRAALLLKNYQAVNALTPEEIKHMVQLGIKLDDAANKAQRLAYHTERVQQATEAAAAASAAIATGLSNAAAYAGILDGERQ